MSQANPVIGANKSGLDYRQEDNDGKRALLNHHKNATAPDYAEAGLLWLDDSATPWVLKFYDGADWIACGAFNAASNAFTPYQGTDALRYANHAADTGSADAYAVSPVPALSAYALGQVFTLKPANANTGACTLSVCGMTAKNIKLQDASDPAAAALLAGGVYFLFYDGTNMVLLNPSSAGASGGGLTLSAAQGLSVTNNASTPNTKIDIAADTVMTANATGAGKLDTAASLTLDATTTGANGLDTGTLAAGTWYYVWLISNGGTLAALLSLSSSAPALPSGYTYKMLAGYAVTDASAHFIPFIQEGALWLYKSPVFSGMSYVYTSRVDMTTNVPHGKRYRAVLNCAMYSTVPNAGMYVHSPDLTDMAASFTVSPVSQMSMGAGSGGATQGRQLTIMTNTDAKISMRADASGGVQASIATAGFYGRINAV